MRYALALSLSLFSGANEVSAQAMIDLRTLPGGRFSEAHAINAAGQVVGSSETVVNGVFRQRAFLWTPYVPNGTTGTMTDLGTLGGTSSQAFGINDFGQVVGASTTADNAATHAFLYTPGVGMVDLGTPGGSFSFAFSINNLGQVVGMSEFVNGFVRVHAFLWENGVFTDLGTLGGFDSSGRGINDLGQVVGESTREDSFQHAFLWTPGGTDGVPSNRPMKDLGTLGGIDSIAFGINNNNAGQVAGISSDASFTPRAFLWDATNGMQDLGTLGGSSSGASAINDLGQVAGSSDTGETITVVDGDEVDRDPISHAFLWTPGVGMTDLGTLPGGTFSEAFGINDLGQVVGSSETLVDGAVRDHAFLWKPAPSSPAEQITNLENLIADFGLPAGTASSLLDSLEAAQNSLARENTTAACGQLKAFINKAQANFKSGRMMEGEAAATIDSAQAIRTDLGCQ